MLSQKLSVQNNRIVSSLSLNKYFTYSSIGTITDSDGIAVAPGVVYTQSMLANAYFFGHPTWAKKDFLRESHNPFWKRRWRAVVPSLDDKVVVDIGCGFGHVYATLGGYPRAMIGVDISLSALKMAAQIGYMPLLANAEALPLKSGFADVVTLNATLHHCDNVEAALSEAARLVKPGGVLVTDLDPQCSAWRFKGVGLWVNMARRRFPSYWLMRFARYRSRTEIEMRLATETHNAKPGDGMTINLYRRVLEPLGFDVCVHPHNHSVGKSLFSGDLGQLSWPYRLAQSLSGIQPGLPESAQSIMCVARSNRSIDQHKTV